jgi:hypothetical protein
VKRIFLIILMIGNTVALAQDALPQLPQPKRFIQKIEIFAGPNMSFNYGNMFIENYRGEYSNDNYVVNKRLLKPGYVFGAGVYHPFSDRVDLNVRLQYERKGIRTELNTPTYNSNNRIIMYAKYDYDYLTITVRPQILLGEEKNMFISLGGYYSKIKRLEGYGRTYDTNGTLNSEGSYKGRYFYDLGDDGTMQGFSWMPYLTSVEDYDWGLVTSIGYRIPFKEKHSMLIQLQNNFGLKNINKNNSYDLKEKNHTVNLILSYSLKIPLKK